MKLVGVQVCVNFADLLHETLPWNIRHFDDLIIVTAPEDVETQRICRFHNVRHAQTDLFRTRWGEMHKAKGINVGLRQIDLGGWIIHFDADIILPPLTRALIERANLHPWRIYGCDRYNVIGFDTWREFAAMPHLQQDGYHVEMSHFPIAPRFSGGRMGGYAPPGFFQLWNPKGSGISEYPENHSSASRTDVMFASKRNRCDREMLPEFVAYHLMPTAARNGTNWDGRNTPRWGPRPDETHPLHPRNHRPPPQTNDWRVLPGYGAPEAHQHRRPYCTADPVVTIVPPAYEGKIRPGTTLNTTLGTWAGVEPIHKPVRWQRQLKSGEWVHLPHQHAQTYIVQATDVGHPLRSQVEGKNYLGISYAFSEATSAVT